jgi:single-stranded-DNA-specific exonuclease
VPELTELVVSELVLPESCWVVAQAIPEQAARLVAEVGCPEPIARLLAARGITEPQRYFNPTLDHLYDPSLLLGMDAAVARIQRAVAQCEPILIYGDYDVDGTTATVLLKTAIERIAPPGKPAIVTYHVPHRLREGYGIQNVRLAEAAAAGIRVVISVDTGIRAFEAAIEAKALNLDLIVTDHHLPDGVEGIPDAVAVINPAQPGCSYPNKHLCGAGVAFKLAHALLAAHAVTEPLQLRLRNILLPSFLKLVAIATIADSVELTGENRAIVWLGLRELRNPVQPGLRALMQVAELPLDRSPSASEVGFRLAPRINAAGRMDVASDVVELFLTRDPNRATELAKKLDGLNADRRATEAAALEAIELQLETMRLATGSYPPECIVLDHPEWHRGVLGILASRVVDRTGLPALIMTSDEMQVYGSGRSIEGYHLLDALTAAHGADNLFTRFGGHAHAVGFSLPFDLLPTLRERMRMHSRSMIQPQMLTARILCDLELTFADLTSELFRWLKSCAPFGMGAPEPILLARGLTLAAPPRIIKEKHICLPLGQTADGRPLSAMGWSRPGRPAWSQRIAGLPLAVGAALDLVFRLRENTHPQYGGLELELLDLQTSSTSEAGTI